MSAILYATEILSTEVQFGKMSRSLIAIMSHYLECSRRLGI
jgi:hypothetical protein